VTHLKLQKSQKNDYPPAHSQHIVNLLRDVEVKNAVVKQLVAAAAAAAVITKQQTS